MEFNFVKVGLPSSLPTNKGSEEAMKTGYLELILGPMFSGKTSELLKIYSRYKVCGSKILVINYKEDIRYSNNSLSTHDGSSIPCTFVEILSDIEKIVLDESEIILINEGQFFVDIIEWVKYAVDICNKSVYICGLDSDFERNKFGLLLDLIPYCDKVKKLKAICVNCKTNYAIFTHRLGNEKKQKIIGGTSSYISLCRKCFLQINN